jgi:hypothetical protein
MVYLHRFRYCRGRLAEWLKRSRSDQEVVGTNPSYCSAFDAAALGKLQTSGIASPLMQLARREPCANLIIIIMA